MLGGIEMVEFTGDPIRGQVWESQSIEVVAGMMTAGFRLKSGKDSPNHEDVTIGCDRLLKFQESRKMKLERRVRWFFGIVPKLELFGSADEFTAGGMALRWTEDAALRRSLKALPAYESWRVGLIASLRKSGRRVFVANEAGVNCYGAIGGDPIILREFNEMMETAEY
jgi:hypothetical protein